jgi:DNA-binding winged helix-turn-helix (wHTH) protein/TolB-like protein
MDTQAAPRRLHFGRFEFDEAAGELYKDGERVRLQEQPRQVLAALLERPGQIATRDELRERLWRGDTFVDFEHGLNTAIKKVRQALGDSAEAPAFIETLARRGYRFIAPVGSRPAGPPPAGIPPPRPAPAPTAAATARSQLPPVRTRVLLWGITFALTIATAGGVWVTSRSHDATIVQPARQDTAPHLAVMPLEVLAGPDVKDLSYMGVGIADAITTRLANIRGLGLRPTSAVLAYKDPRSAPAAIAATLGVQYLLVGTIQPVEQTYRVNVHLVGADGVAVWARTYDEPRTALLDLQDRIAEHVTTALRVKLSPPERARLHVRYTQNPAAYDLYLRGRSLLVNYTEANMREAMTYFEQALALDQNYALARAGLATAAAWFSVRYSHSVEALAWGKRAEHEGRRALDLDPSLADAHLALASAAGTVYGGFNWPTVLDRTSEALALDPSLDLAHAVRMRVFYHLGLFDQAHAEGQLARALNPTPSVELDRLDVAILLCAGEYQRAVQLSTELLQQTEAHAIAGYLAMARYYTGDVTGAMTLLAAQNRGGEPDARAQASLASIEAATGLRDQARRRATTVARGPDMDHHVAYALGATFAQIGEAGESIRWLEQAADTGFPCYPWFQRDPLLDPVRQQPGFVRLLERMRAAHERSGDSGQ